MTSQILPPSSLPSSIPSSITIGQKIGKGHYGEVYEGTFIDPRTNRKYDSVAIKVIKIVSITPKEVEKQREEVKIVQSILKQQNNVENVEDVKDDKEIENVEDTPITKIIAHIEHGDNLFIIMEKCDGDGLVFQRMIDRLKQKDKYDEVLQLLVKNLIHLCKGLESIHTNCVIHRDIKPANLLFNKSTKTLKFTDFGLSCFYSSCKGLAGTPNYIDPICYIETKFKKKLLYDGRASVTCRLNQMSDVFSLGMTFYFLLTGETLMKNSAPKTDQDYLDCFKHVKQTLDTYKDRSEEWKTFIICIQNMVKIFPEDRATPKQCISYLATNNEEEITSTKAKKEKGLYLIDLSINCT
jgi:serine/threonine protein kinase